MNHNTDVIIIGAGAIGLEFASFYNDFNVEVTLVEYEDNILLVHLNQDNIHPLQ